MAFTKITASGIGSTETVTLDGLSVINDGSFGGNVSVGGTLTYEDVTNIDSVGLITARAGVVVGSGITLSKDGDGFFTGVVTATSYAGDGSALTGIDATQIVTGNTSVQTVDTGSDGHVKVNAEGSEKLRIDSSGVKVGATGANTLIIGSATGIGIATDSITETLEVNGDVRVRNGLKLRSPAGTENGVIELADNDNLTLQSFGSSGYFTFKTGSSVTERLRIASDGKMGLGVTPTGIFDIREDNNPQLTLRANSHADNGGGRLNFGVGVAFAPQDGNTMCSIASTIHSTSGGTLKGDMKFYTNSGDNLDERLRVTSDGYLQQHKLVAVSYSDTRELALGDTDLTTSNFYNTTNFASDTSILDSNGHFVAPVHGIYRLYCRFSSDTDTGNRINVRLRKNGITINEAYGSNESVSGIQSVSSEIIMELDKDEYLDLQVGALHTMAGAQHKVVNFHMLG